MGSFGEKTFQARLNILGEFADRELEKEFVGHEVAYSIRLVRPALLLLGILYFLFIIADYALIRDGHTFNLILLNRALFLLLSIIFHFRLKNVSRLNHYYEYVTAYEIIGTLFLLYIFIKYEYPIFLVQSSDIMILLLLVFLIPNRLNYMIMVSLIISISFFALSFHTGVPINAREFTASIVHIMIVIILVGISALNINRYKRIQYASNKELIRLSSRDSLTGIYNRHRFEEELYRSIRHAQRYGTQLSLILFDIDDFKRINDNYGHLTGDQVLIEVTRAIKMEIRESDMFCRWGGEEFALILLDTDKENATELAQRLRTRICCTYFDPVGQITCSFGITSFNPGDDSNSLIERVDRFMHMAKQLGKDQVINDF